MFNQKKGIILFIVEGESREIKYFESIKNFWFKNKEAKLIALPARENIYMLWKTLKEDEFNTDLVELLKERLTKDSLYDLSDINIQNIDDLNSNDIDEIFLFFDFDAHVNNIPDNIDKNEVINEMLETFNNETDNGKLYISYPMIEALRDWVPDSCKTVTGCTYNISNLTKYKYNSGLNPENNNPLIYSQNEWKNVITNYIIRVAHLFNLDHIPTFIEYRNNINTISIFYKELLYISKDLIFILSAIPEFILDYFNEKHWNNYIKRKRLPKCDINNKCIIK